MNAFCHLHVHTEYSLVDSLVRLDPLLKACQHRHIPAVAMTDVVNLFGAVKFYEQALAHGIKPIFGCDIWHYGRQGGRVYRLTLLAETQQGYQNLVELISQSYLDADRLNGIPVIPNDWLIPERFQGLIGLSGALDGEIGQCLVSTHSQQGQDLIEFYQGLFGVNCFFIELTRTGHPHETLYEQQVIPFAIEYQIPVVATNNVRFLNAQDYQDHEVRVGIYEGYTLLDETRVSRYREQQFLRSADQMATLFSDFPSAIENTLAIAKRCNVTFTLGQAVLPKIAIPEGLSEADFFSQQAYAGLEKRFELWSDDQLVDQYKAEYQQRLQREIDVICQMGFPGYFLIVADFIQWAKDHDIPVGPGRGSGAGSLVAYALKITDIDPIPYGLLFERFLNPERVSMPDFDIDFCINGRDHVIEYVAHKYGENSVSQIITYGTMAAKAVVRDVGRVMGQPYGLVDQIAKLVPDDLGVKLKDVYVDGEPLYEWGQKDEVVDHIVTTGIKLEGLTRNIGKHAAGVVIAPTVVTDFTPTCCEEGSRQLITQFDKKDVESVGLVKFDFLGLRNLTIIDSAIKIANDQRQKQGKGPIDLNTVPMDDPETFELLKRAETTGVFQLESHGMKELIKKLAPDCFEEIIALVALYRPGPLGSGMVDDFVNCKHGRQAVRYPHPALQEVLQETYGTILYQEQVMQIAQILANYSLGAADILRRAMGKKKPEEMAKQRQIFEQGAQDNNIDPQKATEIFDLMEEFANYGFNKSHSAAYALIAYQTAWLKAHYPAAFMAALLSSDMDKTDKVVTFVMETQAMGLRVDPPDINKSMYHFTVNENADGVLYGLGAIKGVGQNVIEHLVEVRQSGGAFQDLFDFCQRVDIKKFSRRTLEFLIYAGAFDMAGFNRATLVQQVTPALKVAEQNAQSSSSGQSDLFGLQAPQQFSQVTTKHVADQGAWGLRETLIKEKQVLGLTLSGHLIDADRFWLDQLSVRSLEQLQASRGKQKVTVAGVITEMKARKTKKGHRMGIMQIDDGTKRMEVVVFTELFEQIQTQVAINDVVIIQGEVSLDGYTQQLRLSVNTLWPIDTYIEKHVTKFACVISSKVLSTQYLDALCQQVNVSGEKAHQPWTLSITLEHTEYQAHFKSDAMCCSIYSFYQQLQQYLGQHLIKTWVPEQYD